MQAHRLANSYKCNSASSPWPPRVHARTQNNRNVLVGSMKWLPLNRQRLSYCWLLLNNAFVASPSAQSIWVVQHRSWPLTFRVWIACCCSKDTNCARVTCRGFCTCITCIPNARWCQDISLPTCFEWMRTASSPQHNTTNLWGAVLNTSSYGPFDISWTSSAIEVSLQKDDRGIAP